MRSFSLVFAVLVGCNTDQPPQQNQPTIPVAPDLPVAPPYQVGDPVVQFYDGKRPKNLLFISTDTFRKDHLSPYDDDADLTPFLRQIYDQSVTLDRHVQCSNWTYASTSCTLNGKYHEENQFLPRLAGSVPFPDGQTTIAGLLGQQGYWSTLVAGNAWLSSQHNNAQGYTTEPPAGGPAMNVANRGVDHLTTTIDPQQQSWFMHIHFMEPHVPYDPPAEYIQEVTTLPPLPDEMDLTKNNPHYAATGQWDNLDADVQQNLLQHMDIRYRGEVRYLDDQFADVWSMLQTQGLLEDTLVVIWNDHGEAMFEHDVQSHAHKLYGEENDGFAMFWSKDIVPRHWTQQTHAVDLMPTVMDALGYGTPMDRSGVVAGQAADDRPVFTIVDARSGIIQAVTKDNWKLHYSHNGHVSLYDRNTDLTEAVDLFQPDHPKAIELWALLQPRVEMVMSFRPLHNPVWPTIGALPGAGAGGTGGTGDTGR